MSANSHQTEMRQTRARSREVDSTPTSPKKSVARPRRGRSASKEPNDNMEYAQATQHHPSMLPTIDEDSMNPELLAQLQNADRVEDPSGQSIMPWPTQPPAQFQSAPLETIKNVRNRNKTQKRGPRSQQQQQQLPPPATAPTAVMVSDQAQTAQQIAQDASRQMPAVDPQLEQSAVQPMQRKSLFDRQDDAVRVSFDDSQNSAYQQAIMQPQGQMEEMPATQDDGFQADTRSLGSAPAQRRQRAPKRPRQSSDYQPESTPPPEESSPPSPRGTPPPSNYAQVQQQAKLFTAGLRRDKVPQKRKAWTSEECDALIDGIGQYGNAYATLKAEDHSHRKFLSDRSAEDLRHKARNMKFDYLKAGVELPVGFDSVLLDKKFKDKLAAMGREYTQTQMRQTKRPKTREVPDEEQENNDEENPAVQE